MFEPFNLAERGPVATLKGGEQPLDRLGGERRSSLGRDLVQICLRAVGERPVAARGPRSHVSANIGRRQRCHFFVLDGLGVHRFGECGIAPLQRHDGARGCGQCLTIGLQPCDHQLEIELLLDLEPLPRHAHTSAGARFTRPARRIRQRALQHAGAFAADAPGQSFIGRRGRRQVGNHRLLPRAPGVEVRPRARHIRRCSLRASRPGSQRQRRDPGDHGCPHAHLRQPLGRRDVESALLAEFTQRMRGNLELGVLAYKKR